MILLNDKPINVTIFPDKTSQVWKLDNIKEHNIIEWRFESEAEFMHLAQLKYLLNNESVPCILLKIPYWPYARQDKGVSNKSCFALIPFLDLLKMLDFKYIEVIDPHCSLYYYNQENDGKIIPIRPNLDKLSRLYDTIVFPDMGAYHRYRIPESLNEVVFDKERDVLTGEIIGFSMSGTPNGRCLIIDDICDGGATFISIAKHIGECDLYVSHGLFTKGRQVLHDAGIKNIYTYKDLEEINNGTYEFTITN